MQPAELRVLFLGCGDLGTGAAHRLCRAGFPVAIAELAVPLAVRRRVAFAEAARSGAVTVEGVTCRRVELETLRRGGLAAQVALCLAPIHDAVAAFAPRAIVDARMTKRPLEVALPDGVFRVALGPGHAAGEDCDAVVETLRGPDLGRVLRHGAAAPDTGIPGEVGGATGERLLRSPAAGTLRLRRRIGDRVAAGEILAEIAGHAVRAGIAGLVRGLLADGDLVAAGQKLGDIDPRPDAPATDRISDKAHRVGEGVLTAVATHFGIDLGPG